MKYRVIAFDYDGTLVDTFRFHVNTIGRIVRECGACASKEERARLVCIPLDAIFEQTLPKGKNEEALLKLKKLYKNILPSDWQNMKLIEYVKETLDELKMQGVRIALITNSHRDLISASLAYFQLDSYFDWVLAAGDVMLSKEERLGRIQQEAKVEKQEVLYVGDTAGDIIAAHHVGIDGALIINDYSWFFRQKEEMSIPNTEYVLKNISEILNI